jgi:hypothetical protein
LQVSNNKLLCAVKYDLWGELRFALTVCGSLKVTVLMTSCGRGMCYCAFGSQGAQRTAAVVMLLQHNLYFHFLHKFELAHAGEEPKKKKKKKVAADEEAAAPPAAAAAAAEEPAKKKKKKKAAEEAAAPAAEPSTEKKKKKKKAES